MTYSAVSVWVTSFHKPNCNCPEWHTAQFIERLCTENAHHGWLFWSWEETLRRFTTTSPHSTVAVTHSQQTGDSRRVQQFLKGEWESLWNKCMAKGHARLDKLANQLSASSCTSAQKDAMASKQARAGNLSKANQTVSSVLKPAFGTMLCSNYRQRHRLAQTFSTNNSAWQQMRSMRCADKTNGSTFKKIRFLQRKLGNIFATASLWVRRPWMDGEDANTLDDYLQMLFLLYRIYFASISF